MWMRPSFPPQARMPSMRPQPTAPAKPVPAAVPAREDDDEAAEPTRAGGFHESSYELRTGMDMMETEWPDDTTVPGALDDGAILPRR